jgi:hypothetical protein
LNFSQIAKKVLKKYRKPLISPAAELFDAKEFGTQSSQPKKFNCRNYTAEFFLLGAELLGVKEFGCQAYQGFTVE